MTIEKIPVVSASDEHYAPYLCVMITSLLEKTSPDTEIDFYILDDHISKESKGLLQQTVKLHSNQATIEFIPVDRHQYENFLVSDHITTTAYFRLSLPKLLKDYSYRKILYIDADTLILADIRELYNSSLHGKIIGAVIDPGQTKALKRLGIPSTDYYFNSGVMVVDLQKWNEHKITEKALAFLTEHGDRILYHDQDALNAVLYEHWAPLHPKWNMQTSLIFERHPAPTKTYEQLYREGNMNPSIVHFTGHDKPWNTLKNHPYQQLYMAKLAETLFKDAKNEETSMNDEEITIVSCCNDAFVPHLTTLFLSILENTHEPMARFSFYIIEDEISERNKQLLRQSIASYRAKVEFLRVDMNSFSHVVESDRIPRTAYFRIVAPELFRNTGVKTLLYLDCDMVAVTDIAELWTIDLSDYLLAAVEDAGFHHRLEKMKLPVESALYFNSGFMLINVEAWLKKEITFRVLNFIENHPEKLRFHDQDALNAVLCDQWLQLHPSWNAQSYIMEGSKKHPLPQGEKEYEETRRDPKIIHYSGHVKPWHAEFDSPTLKYYEKYYSLTAFPPYKQFLVKTYDCPNMIRKKVE
ncbi:glycosyltransferase family 8 protein [uncultured Enterococcus sp.]|uniref:glycosyltransferase family 8 protein n=1 Tax=uncultured Enterococcus sp. TaxID=167972 RepID=UPI002AA70316|nr:glycosyltransferase family 8 protein [uncultured Enterococcus sp.]